MQATPMSAIAASSTSATRAYAEGTAAALAAPTTDRMALLAAITPPTAGIAPATAAARMAGITAIHRPTVATRRAVMVTDTARVSIAGIELALRQDRPEGM